MPNIIIMVLIYFDDSFDRDEGMGEWGVDVTSTIISNIVVQQALRISKS